MLDPEKIRTPRNKYYPARNRIVLEQYKFNCLFACCLFLIIVVCILWQGGCVMAAMCGGKVNRRTPIRLRFTVAGNSRTVGFSDT